MNTFYPLTIGNTWKYRMKDGVEYSNLVQDSNNAVFTILNSMTQALSTVKKEGNIFLTDAFEKGNFQPFLKDAPQKGDAWQATFTANSIKSILKFTVKEILPLKEVEGKQYSNVAVLEAESNMEMNGTILPLNFSTQYYYAENIGLILTTSSFGDYQALCGYTVKVV